VLSALLLALVCDSAQVHITVGVGQDYEASQLRLGPVLNVSLGSWQAQTQWLTVPGTVKKLNVQSQINFTLK
jgi:hypothetical protein